MKRAISVVCVSLAFVCCFAVPAHAAEISNDIFFDVLHYSTPNNSDQLFVNLKSGDSVTFDVPYDTYFDIDMLIRSDFTDLSVVCNQANLTVVPFDPSDQGNLYRVYGTLRGEYLKKFTFTFTFTTGTVVIFESLRCSTLDIAHFDIPCSFDINTPSFQGTINHEAGKISSQIIPANTSYDNNFFYCFIQTDYWKKYDFLDFTFLFECSGINSIAASFGEIAVPLSISKINDGTNYGEYFVTMRLDLRGLDRSSSDYPMITVSGSGKADNATWSIACLGVSGFILPAIQDTESFNLMRIFSAIQSGFNNVISGFDSLDSALNTIKNAIDQQKNWLGIQIDGVHGEIERSFDYFKKNFIQPFHGWLQDQTDSIVSAIKGDSSAGNEFLSGVGEKKDQVDQMIGVMGSVNKPDLGSFDMSGGGLIDQNVMLTSMSGLSAVIKDPIFLPIITLSLTLATAAYVLFGKR